MKELNNLKIAYWPYNQSKNEPGDRRRFLFYTNKKKISFEFYNPSSSYNIVLLSEVADIGIIKNLKKNNTKVIYECIDSYYLDNYEWKDTFRGLAKYLTRDNKKLFFNYRNALKKILSDVDGVTCASKEQASQLSEFNDNVHWIPDMPNDEIINVKSSYSKNGIIKLVWEGLPSNVYQLNNLKTVFKRFSESYSFDLHVITNQNYYKHMNRFGRVLTKDIIKDVCENIIFHEWDTQTYSKLITECDIAIIPIDRNNIIALGKPENKLIIFWKMGIPTITTATKSYDRVMQEAGIELTCKNNDDWLKHLSTLSSNEGLRKSIGIKGKRYAEENYSEKIVLDKWDKMFESII